MNSVTVSAVFESSVAKVWQALTNPEAMKIWYFDIANFQLEIGNEFSFYETDGTSFFHLCKMVAFEENKLLQHTWTHPQQSKGSSVVTWKIESLDENKVQVTLIHDGLETFADGGSKFAPENYEMGWNALVKTSLRNYLYNIQKLVFSVSIEANSAIIWNKMWDKSTYTQWVEPFCEGTYFTGEIELGNRIHFLAPSGSGMYSDVFYLIPNQLIIFKHIGNVEGLNELPLDAETEKWTGSFEVYKLKEENGKTTVTAEIDCIEQYIDYMNEKFPLALQQLKKLSEN